jgi:predicted nucleic acid-binding protein
LKAPIFIDTGYILALANTRDKYHSLARDVSFRVKPPFLTTEAVLIEISNALSGLKWRSIAIATLEDLRSDPHRVEVLPVDTTLFERAFSLYRSRRDKTWGMTDCISFVVMREKGLRQALTTDQDFEQAGFQNILISRP